MTETLDRVSYTEDDPDVLAHGSHESESQSDQLAERLSALPGELHERIDQAVENSEFENSQEIEDAIKGYYVDHYKAALIAEQVIEGKPLDPEIISRDETALEAYELTKDLERIITAADRGTQLNELNEFIEKHLFAEVAVGQTTINESELALTCGLAEQLTKHAEQEGVYIRRPTTEQEIIAKRQGRVKEFWEDSRAAGQLEFHNTPFADKAALDSFKLRTRSNQLQHKGDFNAVTTATEGHSQSLHFSEEFMSDGYKKVQMGKQVDEVTIGGTIAVPIAEVVKQLPYARGGEYGVLTLKDGVEPKYTVTDTANIYAFGGGENPGADDTRPSKWGTDRTFYADKYDRKKGENYELDYGQMMKSEWGNTSKVIFLQRDINTAHRKQYLTNGKNVDHRINFGSGEGYPLVEVIDYDYGHQSFSDAHGVMKEGERFVPKKLVDYSANALGINDPRLERVATGHYSYQEGVTPQQQEERLRTAIREMQRESREHPKYRGKVVAMLRSGTMAFKPAG